GGGGLVQRGGLRRDEALRRQPPVARPAQLRPPLPPHAIMDGPRMRLPRVVVAGLCALAGVGLGPRLWPRHHAPPPEPAPPGAPARAPPPPAPTKPAPPLPTPPARPAPAPAEQAEMEHIRGLIKQAPLQALDLLDTADRAYPTSPFSEERASLRIDALVY